MYIQLYLSVEVFAFTHLLFHHTDMDKIQRNHIVGDC